MTTKIKETHKVKKNNELIDDFLNIEDYINIINDFSLVSNLKKVNNDSANATLFQLTYTVKKPNSKKVDYIYSILKASKKKTADNIIYEYLMGLVLNDYIKKFPCFIYTYGIYMVSETFLKKAKKLFGDKRESVILSNLNSKKINNNILTVPEITFFDENTPEKNKKLIKNSCNYPDYYALMLEYIDNFKTFDKLMMDFLEKKKITKTEYSDFFNIEFLSILFQIYIPLYGLRKVFTHYDLHTDNVLIQKIDLDGSSNNQCISFKYNVNGINIEFKSKYMIKIIDYGRSYIEDLTHDVIKEVCDNYYTCGTEKNVCGSKKGYAFVGQQAEVKRRGKKVLVSDFNKNESQDLRLLHMFNKYYTDTIDKNILDENSIYNEIDKFIISKILYMTTFSTPEIINNSKSSSELHKLSNSKKQHEPMDIKNIEDVVYGLIYIYKKTNFKQQNAELYKDFIVYPM